MSKTEQTMAENTSQTLTVIPVTASAEQSEPAIAPWVGLIILGVLIVTGIAAVIREIYLENDDEAF